MKRKREDVKTDAIEEQRVSERESEMCTGFNPERDEEMRRRRCTQGGACESQSKNRHESVRVWCDRCMRSKKIHQLE